jgi:hypothetical protein
MDKLRKVVGIHLGATASAIALLDAYDSALITSTDSRGRAAKPEASAEILRSLRDELTATLNDRRFLLDAAVLTVPAEATPEQVDAMRLAGELAGFAVAEILPEPDAVAVYDDWSGGHGGVPEPLLCTAFGAALQGGKHGLRFVDLPGNLELHVTTPARSTGREYTLAAAVQGTGASEMVEGGSVRVRSLASGRVEEAFLDERGKIAQMVSLEPECDNALEITLCDSAGGERVSVPFCVRHCETPPQAGQAATPARRDSAPAELQPPWKTFSRLVKDCLILAGEVAERTGRDRQELFEQVYAQERFAEQAFAGHNAASYRECFDNLRKFLGYLQRLGSDHMPGGMGRAGPPTMADARAEVHRLRNALTTLASAARSRRRPDLQERAAGLNAQAERLLDRAASDVNGTLSEAQKLWAEYDKVEAQLTERRNASNS